MIYNFDFTDKFQKVDHLSKERFRNNYAPITFDNKNHFNIVYNTPYLKVYYYAREELKKILSDLYFDPYFAKDSNPIDEARKIVKSILQKHTTYETQKDFNKNLIMLYNNFDCEYRSERISC